VASPGEHLRVDVRHETDRIVLGLHGELDLLGAPLLQEAIDRADDEASAIVVLDLQDLQFVDSAGLRVILAAHERSRQNGQELALTPGTEQVQRLFTIAGVKDHLRIIGSPDELFV
jgi:anti-sigma B factor antagonist